MHHIYIHTYTINLTIIYTHKNRKANQSEAVLQLVISTQPVRFNFGSAMKKLGWSWKMVIICSGLRDVCRAFKMFSRKLCRVFRIEKASAGSGRFIKWSGKWDRKWQQCYSNMAGKCTNYRWFSHESLYFGGCDFGRGTAAGFEKRVPSFMAKHVRKHEDIYHSMFK